MPSDRPLTWPEHVALSKSTPLAPYQVDELLASHERLLRERDELRALLDSLPANVSTIRTALNELHRVVSR
jgi:hypothetical protein